MTVFRARKKPVEIECMHLTNSKQSHDAVINWIESWGGHARSAPDHEGLIIETLEGDMLARWGWWIIRGVQGEFYPCEPAIFDKTYEVLDD